MSEELANADDPVDDGKAERAARLAALQLKRDAIIADVAELENNPDAEVGAFTDLPSVKDAVVIVNTPPVKSPLSVLTSPLQN